MPMHTDISSDFAAFAAQARYEDLPADAIEGAKKSILDTLGVILAASGVEPAVRGVAELVRESGGRAESSVLGFGGKVPAAMAAFANGAMAHCLDFDDHAPEGHHPSSSIVPAALAVAERRGGVSGRDLIAAVAAGQDMFLRLRRNVGWKQDWHLTTVLGVFSATASACRVLGLDADRTVNALGIASMQSCGTMELAYGVGSDPRCWPKKAPPASAACSRARPASSTCTSTAHTTARRYCWAWAQITTEARSSTSPGRPAVRPMASFTPRSA
jgi:2-methylcitrate dehydratase PrpD